MQESALQRHNKSEGKTTKYTPILFLRYTSLSFQEIVCKIYCVHLYPRHSCGGAQNLIKQLSLFLKIPCLSVAKKKKKNRGSEALKAKKAVLLLLFPMTYKRRKFSCVKKNSQNLEPPQPQSKHNCPSLLINNNCFLSI